MVRKLRLLSHGNDNGQPSMTSRKVVPMSPKPYLTWTRNVVPILAYSQEIDQSILIYFLLVVGLGGQQLCWILRTHQRNFAMRSSRAVCTTIIRGILILIIFQECKGVFIAAKIGKRDFTAHINALLQLIERRQGLLRNVVLLDGKSPNVDINTSGIETYSQFILRAQ